MSENFFSGKRHWSVIKDNILRNYLPPYLRKVRKLQNEILLIDAFAGPGLFEDGTIGSPLILVNNAEIHAKDNYSAIFVNIESDHHNNLTEYVESQPWSDNVQTLQGDSRELLDVIARTLNEQTVFLYLDPFGLDCSYEVLQPFITRESSVSTEILINLNMQAIHRLKGSPNCHQTLDKVFGGSYWKPILNQQKDTKLIEQDLVKAYTNKLSEPGYLSFTGACPVRERLSSNTKYYMVFASRHPDALELMNDTMCKAFSEYMVNTDFPMFACIDQGWQLLSDILSDDTNILENIVLDHVSKFSNKTRREIWLLIIQEHFMRYTASQYKATVKKLVSKKRISFSSSTGRLNDDCRLSPPAQLPFL